MSFFYHRPIWILANKVDWGPKTFKVFNRWIEHPNFKSFVEDVWKSNKVICSCAYVLNEELKFLKEKIKRRNVEVFEVINIDVDEATN